MKQKTTAEVFGIPRSKFVRMCMLLGLYLFTLFFGPITIVLAWLIQRWAAAESWRARDRWASIGGFAWLFGGIATILCLSNIIWIPFVSPIIVWLWELLPGWSRLLQATAIRWCITLPFAPALAVLAELVQPRTQWHPHRVLTPSERAFLQAEAEKQRVASLQAEARKKEAERQKAERQQAALLAQSSPPPDPKRGKKPRKKPSPKAPKAQRQQPPTEQPTEQTALSVETPLQQETLWMPSELRTPSPASTTSAPPAPPRSPIPLPEPSEPSEPLSEPTQQPELSEPLSEPIQQPASPAQQPAPPKEKPKYDWNTGEGSLKDL